MNFAIFIPCYNASQTIVATLDSVNDAMLHYAKPVDVYLYDDCSNDDSVALARAAWKNAVPLHIEQNSQNLGERLTSNKAFEYFSGRYQWVFIIHADDLVRPHWLKDLTDIIGKADQQSCFTVWSSYDSLENKTGKLTPGDNSGLTTVRRPQQHDAAFYLTKLYSSWHISGAALNANLYAQLGGFDSQMPQFGDTDFFVRGLMAGYHDIYLGRSLTAYRIFPDSVSDVSVKTNRDIREIYMLLKKYQTSLTRSEQGRLYGIIQTLGLKRCVKSLMKKKFNLSLQNAGIFIESSFQRLKLLA